MSILRRIANLFRRSKLDEEIEAELRSHIEMRTADNIAAGMSPEEARRQAVLRFGSRAAMKERVIEADAQMFLDLLWQDLHYALRVLRKAPGFAAVAILTLALGIGANTAIFSFLDAVLLRPIPVKDAQQLVVFRWRARANPKLHGHSDYGDCTDETGIGDCSFSVPFYKTVRAQAGVFSGTAAFAGPLDVDLSGNGAASIVRGLYVSGDFFSTLGVNTILGRPLALPDDSPSAPPVIVLGYPYWVRAFGAAPSVVGRTVRLDNTTVTIVGVADPHFTNLTPGKPLDLFMPFSIADTVRGEWWHNQDRVGDPANWWAVIIGRLQPGASVGQAQAAATRIFRNEVLHGASPLSKAEDAPIITLRPLRSALNGETSEIAPPLYVTMTIVAFILLIACANVAGLTLARSASRQKEIAVRLALGAGRRRIIRQLLTESVLLAVAGGTLGVLVAVWGVRAITNLLSNGSGQPFSFTVALDWRTLLFTVVITFLTGILFGLAPALRSSRVDLTPSLKESASSLEGMVVPAGRRVRLGDALVVGQVALSMIVLVGAGLLVRTLRNLRSINPGFDAQNVLLFGVDPTIAGYTDEQTQQLYANLQQRFAVLPGVSSVSYSEDALLDGGWSAGDVHVDGAAPKEYANTGELRVGLNFFPTMRIPILAGRAFSSADFAAAAATNAAEKTREAAVTKANPSPSASTSPTALDEAYSHSAAVPVVINESFARKYLADKNPMGLHLGDADRDDIPNPGPGYTIVGVAGDTKYAQLRRKTAPILFLPLVSNSAHFELRSAANPTALVKNVREIVSQAGDNLPLTDVRTQTEQIDQILFQERLMSRLSSCFGALALVLACIGLYGLLSYEVARRTRELGIRMALGAHHGDLLRLVIGQGMLLALIGAAIGIAGAMGLTRFMSAMLYGIPADDPATFAGVAILLMLVALFACYIPARRAMKVDPMVALRYE
ncbi:MAG TPA: ABC transporter permease [Candidatus Limnocylindrales bacterium]|nr:ABC transporter permease [Candidatus Limnocylindrales bacterium]